MSVNEIDAVVLLFPNQEWRTTATDVQLNAVVAQLRPNISYSLFVDENLQTLSTHTTDRTGTISGFLYVPDLNYNDPCHDLSKNYVPTNVTRQANLPPTDFTLIALAPWINSECTLAYLAAARQDPMRGFIFYLPGNGTTQPPPANSSVWDLGDAGKWKSTNGYPVYAVPSDIGQEMMYQSSLYSGNMTNVPYGHEISELPGIDPRDYVRIYTEIHVSVTTQIPSLWVLLLAIVAVLFLMLAITSGVMHLIQRSRRKSLQRRVASGEVNLEALGIKRLTVPQQHIDKLPLFTYNLEADDDELPPVPSQTKKNSTSTATTVEHDNSSEGSSASAQRASKSQDLPAPLSPISLIDESVSSPDSILGQKYVPYSQPTCPICLDDFESGTTAIRELPCGHIFHPSCIDSFLSNNSSLCPMCKKSVLPKGYCPIKINNAMVRRERNIRRLRSRVLINDEGGDVQSDNARNRIRQFRADVRRVFRSTEDPEPIMVPMEPQPVLMTNAMPENPHVSILGNEVPESLAPGLTRQDIAQQRIRELAADRSSLDDRDAVNERRRPRWRKQLSKVFPGFS